MIEAGKYKARAIPGSAQFGRASTGTEQVAVTFALLDERLAGEEITWVGNFANEQGTEISIKALQAAGWASDDLGDMTGLGDTEVQLVVEVETYEGKPRAKVRWVNKGGAGFAFKDVMDRGGLASLANRIKGQAIALRAEAGASVPARGAQVARGGGGYAPRNGRPAAQPEWNGTGPDLGGGSDDIPF